MEVAIKELCRVASKGVCVGFFNMHDNPEHIVKPVGDYHWNTVSRKLVEADFGKYFSRIRCVCIDELIRSMFGNGLTGNPKAYVLVAEHI